MERELFTWQSWDQHSVAEFEFYDVELIRAIGPYQPGQRFKSAYINFDKGQLALYDDSGEEVLLKKLTLTIVD